jgi:hypothetical protein
MATEAEGLAGVDSSSVVLIGCHEYATLEPLPAVRNNLRGLARTLTDPEVWGVWEERVTVLPQPGTDAEVLDAVREAAAVAEDTLLVYYAGHGLLDPEDGALHLALPGSRLEDSYVATALRYDLVRRVFLNNPASRKVLLLDCCYSGRAVTGDMGPGGSTATLAPLLPQIDVAGTCVITSTSKNVAALAPPGERYTAFTGELLHTLERGVPGVGELLDMRTIYEHVWAGLRAKSRPLPERSSRNTADRICIARNRAAAAPGTVTASGEPGAAGEPLPLSTPLELPPPPPPPQPSPLPPAEDVVLAADGPNWTRTPSRWNSLSAHAPGVLLDLHHLVDGLLAAADPVPVTVLSGPRGSGKTSALEHIAAHAATHKVPMAQAGRQVPSAREPRNIRQLLTAVSKPLVTGFRRPVPTFDRLNIALSAAALARMPPTRRAPSAMARELFDPGARHAQHKREFLPWFTGGIDSAASGEPLDVLVELNRRPDSQWANRLLCRAFLADLHAFHAERHKRYVVLLDNADAPVRSAFLDELTRARRNEPSAPGRLDGLIVIAASSAELGTWSRTVTVADSHDKTPLAQAGYADTWTGRSWYTVVMRGLSEAESAGVSRPTLPVRRLAGDHFGGTRLLSDYPAGTATATATLAHWFADDSSRPNKADRELHRLLLPDLAEAELHTLSLIAGLWGPDFRWSDLTSQDAESGDGELLAGARALRVRLRQRLWMREEAHPTLHPWLHTLLLRRLAADRPDPADPQDAAHDGWTWAHTAGQEIGRRRGDAIRRLYHVLALGDVHTVVRHLKARWAEDPSSVAWLGELDRIAAAPQRVIGHNSYAEPHATLNTMAEPGNRLDEPDRTLWRLVCARTLLASPLHDPARALRHVVADELRDLGRHSPRGYRDYFDEAERYERPRG